MITCLIPLLELYLLMSCAQRKMRDHSSSSLWALQWRSGMSVSTAVSTLDSNLYTWLERVGLLQLRQVTDSDWIKDDAWNIHQNGPQISQDFCRWQYACKEYI